MRAVALAAGLLVASPALALTPGDFDLRAPGLSVQQLYSGTAFAAPLFGGPSVTVLADGSLVGHVDDPVIDTWRLYRRLHPDGSMSTLFSVNSQPAVGCGTDGSISLQVSPSDGSLLILLFCGSGDGVNEVWRISGLPRPAGNTCPAMPGDLAPGVLDDTVTPARFKAQGDGVVNVGDTIVVLRAAVGLHQIVCEP